MRWTRMRLLDGRRVGGRPKRAGLAPEWQVPILRTGDVGPCGPDTPDVSQVTETTKPSLSGVSTP
jgi:hypothetical protein